MAQTLPKIGIACDVIKNGLHQFHGAGEKYINAVAHGAGAIPLLLPAFGNGNDIVDLGGLYDVASLVNELDGLFLTGSPSNIQPHHYDGSPHREGTLEDKQRDSLTLKLIKECISQSIPILAVCRGFQELNVALGGTLHAKVHEVEGFFDHREDSTKDRDSQYGPSHSVRFIKGGYLHTLTKETSWLVNSLHSQGIDRLADQLVIEAVAEDGLIEAVSLNIDNKVAGWVLGVQWHPEWKFNSNSVSKKLLQEFGEQVRQSVLLRKK
jgi:putative glutamine amidotransferase